MVRDFSKHALNLYSNPNLSENRMEYCLRMIKKPAADTDEDVYPMKDDAMKPLNEFYPETDR